MANTITKTTLGEEAGTIIIDRSTFPPVAGTKLVIDKIEGVLSGFTARLLFDATTDLEIAAMPDATLFEYCWKKFGGFPSGKAGAGSTGDVLLTTSGLGNGDRGTFTIHARKKVN
jgi:hypothetical protein